MKFELKVPGFSLKDTLLCGQCFRFKQLEYNSFLVFAKNHSSFIKQEDDTIYFDSSDNDIGFWKNYFDLNTDYDNLLDGFNGDAVLEKARSLCFGIRILRQDPFEALISFIISANNNIPRIQGIIDRLCSNFGTPIKNGFSFPTVAAIANCTVEDLAVLRAGFRARYMIDAAKKVDSGEVDLQEIKSCDIDQAREKLMQICGVGKKVSECVLLFGYHKMKAFPIDVWMRRALEEYYPSGLSPQISSCPGLAQQILFYSKRNHDI